MNFSANPHMNVWKRTDYINFPLSKLFKNYHLFERSMMRNRERKEQNSFLKVLVFLILYENEYGTSCISFYLSTSITSVILKQTDA